MIWSQVNLAFKRAIAYNHTIQFELHIIRGKHVILSCVSFDFEPFQPP